MATWSARNLRRHYHKRLREDAGCFEAILGVTAGTMTESQYDSRSQDVIDNAWGEYEGEAWDPDARVFIECRAYFVDAALVVAITDAFRHEFITCFHEHFGRPQANCPSAGPTEGQRRLRYVELLKAEEQGKMIRKVKRIRGV